MRSAVKFGSLVALPLALAGCESSGLAGGVLEGRAAYATLLDASGATVGSVTASETSGGLNIVVSAQGLPPGEHGAHIHTTGACTAPDFTSAGGHWNPSGANHGTMSDPPHPHAGDLMNITIGADGKGTLTGTSAGTFEQLMDTDGAAFVIHAAADDYKTQPTGNAGARLACGVFKGAG